MVEYRKETIGNDLEFISKLLQNMVQILIEHASDDFWKVLKYASIDALTNPSYTISMDDKYTVSKSNITFIPYNNTISTTAHNEIRLYDSSWICEDLSNYSVRIGFDIICHEGAISLDNGDSAHRVLRHEILKIFNNSYVSQNIGKLTAEGEVGSVFFFNAEYQGYRFNLLSLSM